ncbi:MAG: ArdC family protein [Chitinophagaceae bacterium]|nr:ArdC family protein [Chitinophagaceae bacterium]
MSQTETLLPDVYSIVTNRIIELLEKGTVPWKKPWKGAGIPINPITKNTYRGINFLLLSSLDYDRNLYLTFNQIKELNGSVKRGEVGHVVIFWKKKAIEQNESVQQSETTKSTRTILRYYKVFINRLVI